MEPASETVVIVLDTNVLSELLRSSPDPSVIAWVASRPLATLFTTTVTQSEMLYSARVLPSGQRRSQLESAMSGLFEEDFSGRILSFDSAAARFYAEIAASRRRAGRAISQFDAQIAAITMACGGELATRNVSDFVETGVRVVDPWSG